MEFRFALGCEIALDPTNGNLVVSKTSYVALFIKPDRSMSLMTQFIEEGIKVYESSKHNMQDFMMIVMTKFEQVDGYQPDPDVVEELRKQSDALLAEMNA